MIDMTHKKVKLISTILIGVFIVLGVVTSPALAQDNDEKDTWTLCPEPSQALSEVPQGPAEIQADIDRFTLCLDRAELLLKLEEVSKRNDEIMLGTSADGLSLPITPQPLTAEQTETLLASGDAGALDALPAAALPDYTVASINGANGQLIARLNTPEGDILTVNIDDRLDDESVVTAITASQVSVLKDGKARILKWDQ